MCEVIQHSNLMPRGKQEWSKPGANVTCAARN
jgi:hypothetical protein